MALHTLVLSPRGRTLNYLTSGNNTNSNPSNSENQKATATNFQMPQDEGNSTRLEHLIGKVAPSISGSCTGYRQMPTRDTCSEDNPNGTRGQRVT